MKKCSIRELNYIHDDEQACAICKPPIEASHSSVKSSHNEQFKQKNKITEHMVSACYEYGKQFVNGKIHIDQAVNKVVAETSMNKASAQRMIYDSIRGLLEGNKYASVMSQSATFWLLESIKAEFGEERYQLALKAVEQHLNYYEQLPKGSAQRNIRQYVIKYKKSYISKSKDVIMTNVIRKGKYRHFKGNEYKVIDIAKNSETLEDMVVYKALYGDCGIWVRPIAMWNEIVEVNGEQVKRFTYLPNAISHLWHNGTEEEWKSALKYYDELYRNTELGKYMTSLNPDVIKSMSVHDFYTFLHNKYFVWKYTAKNRLATSRNNLKKHLNGNMNDLEEIHKQIFSIDKNNTKKCLQNAQRINGLGFAGASGLLSILFPKYFGTVDQFVVKSLRDIDDFDFFNEVQKMKPENLSLENASLLELIMRNKATELNKRFSSDFWTPKKIDMVLWSIGHKR